MIEKNEKFLTHKKEAGSDFNNARVISNIKRSEAEYARGEYITWEEMKKELNKRVK